MNPPDFPVPKEILGEIFSFISFKDSDWLHVKLVCKRWNMVGYHSFDPNKCNAWERMWNKNKPYATEEQLIKLLDDKRLHIGIKTWGSMYAVCNRGFERVFVKILQDPRFQPEQNDDYIITHAFNSGCLEIVKALVDDPRISILAHAQFNITRKSFPELANFAAEKGWRYSVDEDYFWSLCEDGELDSITTLIQNFRVNPAMFKNQAIQTVSKNGHSAVVNKLLEYNGVDPSTNGNEAIKLACYHGHLNVVDRLLQDKRVSISDGVAVCYAYERGHTLVLDRLLEDPRSLENSTIMEFAIQSGYVPIVDKLLLNPLFSLSAENSNGMIEKASEWGKLAIVNRLLEDARIDPSANNNQAIKLANENGYEDVVERLAQDPRVNSSVKNDPPVRRRGDAS